MRKMSANLVNLDVYSKEINRSGTPGEMSLEGPQIMMEFMSRLDETAFTLRGGLLLFCGIAVFEEEG